MFEKYDKKREMKNKLNGNKTQLEIVAGLERVLNQDMENTASTGAFTPKSVWQESKALIQCYQRELNNLPNYNKDRDMPEPYATYRTKINKELYK